MKRLFVSTFVSLAALVVTSSASAQEKWNPDSIACADSSPAASYARCALMFEGNKVRRGMDETVVGRPGFFKPIPLERLVVGDSARKFAAQYATRTRQETVLGTLGAAMILAGALIANDDLDRHCAGGICSTEDLSPAAAGLLFGGIGVGLVSIPFHIKAQRAGARAVWWNNLRFAR